MKRHIQYDGSSPLSVLLLYFAEIVTAGDEDWDTTTATLTELTDLRPSLT